MRRAAGSPAVAGSFLPKILRFEQTDDFHDAHRAASVWSCKSGGEIVGFFVIQVPRFALRAQPGIFKSTGRGFISLFLFGVGSKNLSSSDFETKTARPRR